MSIMKKIEIDGKPVAFKTSAAITRIYRIKFQRDIYKDLRSLEKSIGGGNPEDWLDEFNTFSIYQVLPKLIELLRRMWRLKKLHATDREMTTPLFHLRCVQLGISIRNLDLLTIGMVNDMFVESRNDEYKGWRQVATQEDFDRF